MGDKALPRENLKLHNSQGWIHNDNLFLSPERSIITSSKRSWVFYFLYLFKHITFLFVFNNKQK